MKQSKGLTIDDLAGMMQREFLSLHEKMDAGFKDIGERTSSLEEQVVVLGDRITSLENRMTIVESRMTDLESKIDSMQGTLADLCHRVESLEDSNEEIIDRLGRIEQLVDEDQQERIGRLENSMQRVFEKLALKGYETTS